MKPSWDEYFMQMCEVVSSRSIDPSTRHGCVISDKNHRIISTGYNSPIQGIDDSQIPLTRPEKYPYFLHSEENAILFAQRSIEGAIVYITGMPCSRCLRQLLQLKVAKIVYGNRNSHCIDNTDLQATQHMIKMTNIIMTNYIT